MTILSADLVLCFRLNSVETVIKIVHYSSLEDSRIWRNFCRSINYHVQPGSCLKKFSGPRYNPESCFRPYWMTGAHPLENFENLRP